jgi:hypothetical protein
MDVSPNKQTKSYLKKETNQTTRLSIKEIRKRFKSKNDIIEFFLQKGL